MAVQDREKQGLGYRRRGASLQIHAFRGLTLSPLYGDSPVSSRSQNVPNHCSRRLQPLRCIPGSRPSLCRRDHVTGEWTHTLGWCMWYVPVVCANVSPICLVAQVWLYEARANLGFSPGVLPSFGPSSLPILSVLLRRVVSWHHNTHVRRALAHPPTCGHDFITWQI